MTRTILYADGTREVRNVGDGWEAWNATLGIRTGELVVSPDRSLELWCDEDGLCMAEPQLNRDASMLVGRQIVGDVIVFKPGDVK